MRRLKRHHLFLWRTPAGHLVAGQLLRYGAFTRVEQIVAACQRRF